MLEAGTVSLFGRPSETLQSRRRRAGASGAAVSDRRGIDRRGLTIGAAALLAGPLLAGTGRAGSLDTPVSGDGANGARPARSGIAGRVREATGRGIAGIVVMVEKLDPPPVPIPEIANSTDGDGRFFWPLPQGRYRLRFLRDGQPVAERAVTVDGRDGAREIDVIVDATGR